MDLPFKRTVIQIGNNVGKKEQSRSMITSDHEVITIILLPQYTTFCLFGAMKSSRKRAVVVAQLAERLLPIPEDTGSNPVIGNFY